MTTMGRHVPSALACQGNCLRCVFLATERINEQKARYLARYGIVPAFKVMVQEPRVAGVRSRQASRRGVTLDDGFV